MSHLFNNNENELEIFATILRFKNLAKGNICMPSYIHSTKSKPSFNIKAYSRVIFCYIYFSLFYLT